MTTCFTRADFARVLVLALPLVAFPQTSLARGPAPAGIQREVSASTGPLHETVLHKAARLGATTRSASPAQAQPPQRSWASRHPVLMGALVGAGTGAGLTMLGCKVMADEPGIVSCSNWVPILAGVGAG